MLPELFKTAWALPSCFAFQPDVPASCAPEIKGDQGSQTLVESHVERYNPLYYAIVGLPSLLPLSEWTLVGMRLMSALLNALLIACGVRVLAGLRRPSLPTLGFLAALTPMTMFIGGSITPQGPEIFGAATATVTLLAMFFQPDRALLRERLWILAVSVLFFVMARGLSPVYLALILAGTILVAPRVGAVVEVLKERSSWVPVLVCVVLTGGAGLYTLFSGSLALGVVFPDPALTAREVVVQMLRSTDYYLEQVLGTFGWGDTHLPMWVLQFIGGVAFTVGLLGMASGRWRQRVVVVIALLLAILVPIGVQLMSFRESGMVWQGKYVLPLAMLVPLMCGFIAAEPQQRKRPQAAILGMGAAAVAFAQIVSVAVNIHRYANGANGPWLAVIDDPWTPLVPVFVVMAAEVLAWVLIVILVRRFRERPIAVVPDDAASSDEVELGTSSS